MFEAPINKIKKDRRSKRLSESYVLKPQRNLSAVPLSLFLLFKDPNFDKQSAQNSDLYGNIRTGKEKICRVHPRLDQKKTMRASIRTVKVDITPLESETSFPVAVTLLRENLVGANSPPFGLPMILTPL